jgi:hypothetical protein
MIRKIIDFLLTPYTAIKEHYQLKRKLKELRKRDPFIYK